MRIRIFNTLEETEKTMNIWIPTGFIFSRLGMYIASKLVSGQARREYEKALEQLWQTGEDTGLDALITEADMQAAERLTPPITQAQAKELLTALRDSKYLLRGLPLVSIEDPEGVRLRVDL